ncbi:phospholipid carrier-dependent glycosyltransferase [Luteimonas suaedae]|uniref:phospholipid carrier-dependent glycosyltransferase n=1 Tax=Luteimonas suaedae TaxID=2605430 RepID=UPI0011EBF0D4|nr:glycosyltransferase family 39 protein [Luteimonas suaedae]
MASPVAKARSPRRALFPLALLAVAALVAGLGMRDPSPPDEPRFVLAAQHMIASGDWLVPMRGRELYAEKPPVFMWLQATTWLAVRDWRIAFLLPSLLAALATLWLTGDLAARLWRRRYAPWAAGALFVCLQFGLQAKRAQIDMVLVLLTTLSLWGLLRHLLRGPDWRAAWIGAFAAGVGTVTKGVGFLPLLVLLPWLAARRWRPAAVPARADGWRWGVFALCFAAGAAVWLGPLLVAVLRSADPALQAYAAELLLHQTAERYARAWHHLRPPWYYLQVMATLWLPGALLLPWLLPVWWRRLRRGDARLLLLLGWAGLVLLFFSASPGKREVYVFPMLPALCVAAAPLLPALLRRRDVRALLLAWLLALSAALALAAGAALAGLDDWAQRIAAQRAIGAGELQVLLLWLLALGVAGLLLAAWARRRRIAPALLVFCALLWTVYGIGLAPALDRSSSARGLMQAAAAQIGPDAELALLAWREQQLLQADRHVAEFGFRQPWHRQWREASAWLASAPERRWLLLPEAALGPCVAPAHAVRIGRTNRIDWWLVPGTAVARDCTVPPFDDRTADET